MANLLNLLSDKIRRLARREIRAQTQKTRRLTAQHRRGLAALKRQVASLGRAVAFLERQERRRVASPPAPQDAKGVRFSARSVKAQRARLGLSAKDFGRLVGVAALTIYAWESGKSRPRKKQLPGLAAGRATATLTAKTPISPISLSGRPLRNRPSVAARAELGTNPLARAVSSTVRWTLPRGTHRHKG